MTLPSDYLERVYAGVLGKLIGVYLGRPFEGWTNQRIDAELGEINYYVHDRLGQPLIVPDDDISGTFTFFRALADSNYDRHLTAAQIGKAWLNYLIEERTILWWGGIGNSTEHTAYLRLKDGIPAPRSGSEALNGQVVSEQIGAQIFIDAWAMAAPGDPELAVELAARAASVSHDGEAIYGAQVIAALESLAFVEDDLNSILDQAVSFIPADSVIAKLIADLRQWHAREKNWRQTFRWLQSLYGYDVYGGNCHIVPNHGLIILGLLYGEKDFQRSLMITNTCGWDTDCNSGNLGCLLGIWLGLEGIDAGPDWRGPVADRLLLPSADGGRCITDAVQETYRIVNATRLMNSLPPLLPKDGARFHFSLPGSVQGFSCENRPETCETVTIRNVADEEGGALAITYNHLATGKVAQIATPTFVTPDLLNHDRYPVVASPTIYPGQKLQAHVRAARANEGTIVVHPYIKTYETSQHFGLLRGPSHELGPGEKSLLNWIIPDTDSQPIAAVGIELVSCTGLNTNGTVFLDHMTWSGAPQVVWKANGHMALRAWTNGTDQLSMEKQKFRLVQNRGVGLTMQGAAEWQNYKLETSLHPHMVKSAGIAVRVQGMRRYYALLMTEKNRIELVKYRDERQVLATKRFPWQFGNTYAMALIARDNRLTALIDNKVVFQITDEADPLTAGAVAMICEEGRVAFAPVAVTPI